MTSGALIGDDLRGVVVSAFGKLGVAVPVHHADIVRQRRCDAAGRRARDESDRRSRLTIRLRRSTVATPGAFGSRLRANGLSICRKICPREGSAA